MPITIVGPQPMDKIGPGLTLGWGSDFIGPIATGSHFVITLANDAEFTSGFWTLIMPTDVPFGSVVLKTPLSTGMSEIIGTGVLPSTGATVHVQVELKSPTNVVEDSGVLTTTWTATEGVPYLIPAWSANAIGKGLTTAQANQLTDILDGITTTITTATGDVLTTLGQMFSRQTLDRLTLQEITSGETFDPVASAVDSYYFGVIVRVTTIPDAYAPRMIDGDWRYPDLAVLRVYRGIDLEYRKGIHTSSWLAPSPWGYNLQLLNLAAFDTPPPETTVRVDWALGCGGRVYLMAWP